MIIKTELVKRIKEYFNLNIYETKVWLALLSKGVASAGEIAELSGVPRSRTYDVLESLEKNGFAIVKIGKPVKYIAVKPTEVVEKIKSNTLHEAQEKVALLSQLKDTNEYAELEQLHNSGVSPIKHSDVAGSLKGRSNIVSRLRDLIESTQKELVLYTTAADFDDKSRVILPALDKIMKNNVKVKLALSGSEDHIRKISNKIGVKAKMVDSSARMCIADRKEMLFMVTPETAEEEMGFWLSSPFFSQSIYSMLDNTFGKN